MLLATPMNAADKQSLRWLFTFCYRLGLRIGDVARIRLSDIESGDDPLLRIRANRYGNTKNRTPHQVLIKPFLPGAERERFWEWLSQRRNRSETTSEPLFAPRKKSSFPWETRELSRLFSNLMQTATGLDYSPHACRHSLASKLILLVEGGLLEGEMPFTKREQEKLTTAVFTARWRCRDRIWHSSSVFDHADPATTKGNYFHFSDFLLHKKSEACERFIPVETFAQLAAVPQREAKRATPGRSKTLPVQHVLTLLHEHRPDLFDIIDCAPPAAPTGPTATGQAKSSSRPDPLFDGVQPLLEDLEEGRSPEAAATRLGAEPERVRVLSHIGKNLASRKTRKGKPRLMSSNRLGGTPHALSPTRIGHGADRALSENLLAVLADMYTRDPSVVEDACRHWVRHATSVSAAIPFHSTRELEKFLSAFRGADPNQLPLAQDPGRAARPYAWLVRVRPPADSDPDRIRKVWRVFPGLRVPVTKRVTSKTRRYPDGVALLQIVKMPNRRAGAEIDSSKALRRTLHICALGVGTLAVRKARGQ